MAGRSGSSMMMTVAQTLAKDLAYTNCAYVSPLDLHQFAVPGSNLALAFVGDVFVLTVSPHDSIQSGQIGLNAIQRRDARVSTGDSVPVSRFIPPEDFNIAKLTLDLEFVNKRNKEEQVVDAVLLAQQLRKRYVNQVLTSGQRVTFEHHGNAYIFTVTQIVVENQEIINVERGMLSQDSYFVFEASNSSGIKIINQCVAASNNIIKNEEFSLRSLSNEFSVIFRRVFASRLFPQVASKLGVKHVKGMLLYGQPGTDTTQVARQMGNILKGKDPKIVNGPELLSKYVGETVKNVGDLFADAEQDQRTLGDKSELHVIIINEIDAISARDGTGLHDSVVNQLLTKMDGVEALNNVLVIGTTNKKDLLDEALLRPGRLEVHVEIRSERLL